MNLWPFKKKAKKAPRKRSYYSAAAIGRLSNDWSTTQSSSKEELKTSLRILRTRSRELGRNNDYAKRYFNLAKTNVIGHQGIGLQSKALDSSGELDTYANKVIETHWATWGKVGNCDVTRRLSWIDCCKLAIDSIVRDGELLAVSFEGVKRGPHRFQIKLIDPDLLDENYNEVFADGREVIMSIEFDAEGIATHYHILKHHPSDHGKPRVRQKIPVERVCHVFIQDRIDQVRGVPQLVSTMQRLKMLGGYEDAELVAARASASKMGFIYDDEEPDDDYEGEKEEERRRLIGPKRRAISSIFRG